ncbi:hypothetical protein Ddye_001100 [Dipteronia dyeriana]|uniref:RNase H type-1 domain-containing protein n=1 Tax=Dipteronia dyeriana TaxID=168575 RepID=A0AAD9XNG9_9ROSI|nr:hypothetical protein Ddye_001100 [Dipteronia dyeriana]
MWGKEIVDAGSRWRVGDGKSIHIYKDHWIPRPTTFRPTSPSFLGENSTVDKLFSASDWWDVDLIKSVFFVDDSTAILSIIIGQNRVKDSLQWHYEHKDFHNACVARDRLPAVAINRNLIWIPPDPNIYKINCDATINVVGCLVGFGIIICNSEGLVMASSSQNITASFSPQAAEAEAIRRGMLMAIVAGLFPCLLESYAEVGVDWINSVIPLCSEIGVIIMDIQNLLKLDLYILINFVPRNANLIAHVLAKNGLSSVEDMFWLEEFPPCVSSLVSAECHLCL